MARFAAFIAIAVGLSSVASAGEVQMATIKRLMLDRALGEKLFIQLDDRQSAPIACHANTSWEFVLDVSDELGKKMYSSLLTLYASGKPARFVGTEECSLFGGIETLQRLELK